MNSSGETELTRLITQIDIDEQMRLRGVQQAITEAEAWYWDQRAQAFEAAAPKPGDYTGTTPDPELTERCLETAQACRNRATLLRMENAE